MPLRAFWEHKPVQLAMHPNPEAVLRAARSEPARPVPALRKSSSVLRRFGPDSAAADLVAAVVAVVSAVVAVVPPAAVEDLEAVVLQAVAVAADDKLTR